MSALSDGLLDLVNRPRWYYTRVTAGLSVCAGLSGGLRMIAAGEADPAYILAGGLSSGLMAAVVAGTISLWAAETWRVERLKRMPTAGQLPDLSRQPITRYVDARAYAADTTAYQPGLVVIPNERGNAGGMLHVTPEQLTILKRRIRQNNLSLPVNGLDKFSSVQAKALRAEVLQLGLGEAHGQNNQMVRWTGEGAVRVLRASPAGAVPGL